MPLLPFIAGLFTSLAGFFTAWVTKKTALVIAVLGVSAALWVAFAAVVVGLAAGLVAVLPSWAGNALMLFVPSNAAACLSALMAARVARAAYDYHRENLRLAASVS